MQIQPLQTLLAHKVITLASCLSRSQKVIAGALIDHFNRKTGRCDPSVNVLASLAGVDRRTVFRALAKLESVGLIQRRRHGGHWACNAYELCWDRFQELETEWQWKRGIKKQKRTELTPLQRHTRPCAGDREVTQTCNTNLSKRTLQGPCEISARRPPYQSKQVDQAARAGSGYDIARSSAERRWNREFQDHYLRAPNLFQLMSVAITAEQISAITDLELERPGSGLAFIVNSIEPDVAAREETGLTTGGRS